MKVEITEYPEPIDNEGTRFRAKNTGPDVRFFETVQGWGSTEPEAVENFLAAYRSLKEWEAEFLRRQDVESRATVREIEVTLP